MSILQIAVAAVTPLHGRLSFSGTLVSATPQCFLHAKLAPLSLQSTPKIGPIRMGGRTYPGGVSKWHWRRIQSKKSKQLRIDGLALERQIYERRKRAELKAAVSELERPWESVEKAPKPFPIGEDNQLKLLANRFQKPDGVDSDRGRTELFRIVDGLPPDRFCRNRVSNSVKSDGGFSKGSGSQSDDSVESDSDDDEFGEDIYLNRRMGSERGNFDYLLNGLLYDEESDGELAIRKEDNDYEKNRRNSGREMREKVNTLGPKKLNSDNGGSRVRSNSRVMKKMNLKKSGAAPKFGTVSGNGGSVRFCFDGKQRG